MTNKQLPASRQRTMNATALSPRQYRRAVTIQLTVRLCREKARLMAVQERAVVSSCKASSGADTELLDAAQPAAVAQPQLYLKTRWRLFLPGTPCQSPARKTRKPGQALVEFALIMPILLALMLTFLSIWPVLNAGDAVAAATAAGVHEAAITGGDQESTTQRVIENLQAAGIGITESPRVSLSCDPCPRYAPVTVTVEVPVKPWISLPWLRDTYVVEASITRASEIDGGTNSDNGGIRIPGDHPGTPQLPGLPGMPLPPGGHLLPGQWTPETSETPGIPGPWTPPGDQE